MDTRKLEKQFVDFVTEYKQIIYKVCYIYATDSDSLNDLYQETVINLWKSFPRFRGECKASTWVYRIALNTCISFFRKSAYLLAFCYFKKLDKISFLSIDCIVL